MMQNLPNSDIAKDPKKLKERITDLLKGDTEFSKMKQGDKILVVSAASGLFTAVLPLLAVGATLAIPGAIVGLALYFAVKVAVKTFQSGYKGLKWSAEKTVDGAKYTAEKVRDGAVHVKDKVKEGYEHSVDSLKKGASFVGEGVANKFHRASGKEDYLDKIKRFAPEEIRKSDEIRNDLKAIFADKENNSGLVKSILSGVLSEIDLKIEEKIKLGETDQALERLLVQGKFISGLSEKSLHSLLTERSLPKDTYLIDSIFSDHHDEIKRIVGECKREYEFYQSVGRNNAKDAEERKASKSSSFSSVFSLGRKDSEQSNSLSKSSSLNSVRTESTEPLVKVGKNTFYVDTPTPIENTNKTATIGGRPGVARRGSTGNLTRVGTPEVSTRSAPLTNLNELNASSQNSLSEEFGSNPIRADNEVWYDAVTTLPDKGTLTHSNSTDSGMGSGSSTPKSPSLEDLSKVRAELKKTGYLDKLVGQPSTQMAVEADVHPQLATTQGATNVKA
ncbi:hypothetical protein [Wolbachia endosymbiont (group A) of Lasioglossum fulvicorne]|uniref:actin-bundling T4SS effector WalE1 family protein n=1 Tax=Wolbachia endosymbiont (group A) of Lasioglossum fulvicorne TaxID=3066201 RepID=UPI00333EF3E3